MREEASGFIDELTERAVQELERISSATRGQMHLVCLFGGSIDAGFIDHSPGQVLATASLYHPDQRSQFVTLVESFGSAEVVLSRRMEIKSLIITLLRDRVPGFEAAERAAENFESAIEFREENLPPEKMKVDYLQGLIAKRMRDLVLEEIL